MSLSATPRLHYCLKVITLLDELDPKEYNWQQVMVVLQDHLLPAKSVVDLFGRAKANTEFFRTVSKFLMDQERAGLFWVNPQKYADLAKDILDFLHDK